MNHTCLSLIPTLLVLLSACSREDISSYTPVEKLPQDTLLQSIENKRAMIVIAHDDDMCAMAGTASLLNKDGWEIAVVSFSKTPERDQAQIEACKNILDTVQFVDLTPEQIRNDTKEQPNGYYAIPRDGFETTFNREIIEKEYLKKINEFNPTVIFTLDNEMGGYGHPEHVLISQMVIDLAEKQEITPKYIYQSVYTDHMENSIMQRHSARMISWGFPGDEWENAKKTYNVEGMPEPTVQINIQQEAKEKMDYLKSYNERERKVIGFFMPAFEDYSADEYFTYFDREFYRVLKVGDLPQ